jgi:ferrous iron transport protein A
MSKGLLMAVVPLRRMAKGQKGIIHRVTASGEIGRRLLDMGLVPGTPFQVQGRAPLKDPVAIRIRSFTLMLRNSESDFIEAEVEEVS